MFYISTIPINRYKIFNLVKLVIVDGICPVSLLLRKSLPIASVIWVNFGKSRGQKQKYMDSKLLSKPIVLGILPSISLKDRFLLKEMNFEKRASLI